MGMANLWNLSFMTLTRSLQTAPVLKHIISGTRTVLLENPLGNSDPQLWDAVSLQELLKMVFQDYTGVQLCAHSSPSSKLRSPWQFYHLIPARFCLCLQGRYLPSASQVLENFGIQPVNWRRIGHILTLTSVSTSSTMCLLQHKSFGVLGTLADLWKVTKGI